MHLSGFSHQSFFAQKETGAECRIYQLISPSNHDVYATITNGSDADLKLHLLVCPVPYNSEPCSQGGTKTLADGDFLRYRLKADQELYIVKAERTGKISGDHYHRIWNPASQSCKTSASGPYQQVLRLDNEDGTPLITCVVK